MSLVILRKLIPIQITIRRSDKGICIKFITGGISSVRAVQLARCESSKPKRTRTRSLSGSVTRLLLQLLRRGAGQFSGGGLVAGIIDNRVHLTLAIPGKRAEADILISRLQLIRLVILHILLIVQQACPLRIMLLILHINIRSHKLRTRPLRELQTVPA